MKTSLIHNPPPFKGLKIGIPIILPIQGRGFINSESTFELFKLHSSLEWVLLPRFFAPEASTTKMRRGDPSNDVKRIVAWSFGLVGLGIWDVQGLGFGMCRDWALGCVWLKARRFTRVAFLLLDPSKIIFLT